MNNKTNDAEKCGLIELDKTLEKFKQYKELGEDDVSLLNLIQLNINHSAFTSSIISDIQKQLWESINKASENGSIPTEQRILISGILDLIKNRLDEFVKLDIKSNEIITDAINCLNNKFNKSGNS